MRSYCKNMIASRTNRIVMKTYCQQQDKSHRNEQTLVICFTALLFHTSLSGRIAKSLIARRTNRIVMHRYVTVAPMRRCVITCCLDISDRIGLETYYAFHCAAASSSDIFGTAVSIVLYWSIAPKLSRQIFFRAQKQLFQKYPMMTQRRSETHCHLYANTI